MDQIAMCYISMDSSQRAPQTDGSFFKFQFRFQIIAQKPKNIQTVWILVWIEWISLGKLYKLVESFYQISEWFFELVIIFQNNSDVGFMQARWGRHLCWTTRILVLLGCFTWGYIGLLFSWYKCFFFLSS